MKAILSLSINTDTLALIKDKHINLSALVESIFRNELMLDKTENPINDLKLLNAKLSAEVIELKTKLEQAEKNARPKERRLTKLEL